MAENNEGWFDEPETSAFANTPITSESLSDSALAESLSRLQTGEDVGWAGRMNSQLSAGDGAPAYDKTTLTIVVALGLLAVLLFVGGLVYTLM